MHATMTEQRSAPSAPKVRMTKQAAQKLRLELIDAGWRTLESSTDPRTPGATDQTVTIAYFPEFRAYGLCHSPAMVRDGSHLISAASAVEIYRATGRKHWESVELHTN